MKEHDSIRSRIRRRHGYNITPKSNNRSYRLLISVMLVVVVALSFLMFQKTDVGNQVMSSINQTIPQLTKWVSTSFVAKFLPFEKWFPPEKAIVVGAKESYQATTVANRFTSDTNQATALYDGLVVYIGEDDGSRWIVVHHDNQLYATYGNLTNVDVKLYDRVLQSNILGSFDEEVQLEFLYNAQEISYDEAISIQED